MIRVPVAVLVFFLSSLVILSCGAGIPSNDAGPQGNAGGPAVGPIDGHCFAEPDGGKGPLAAQPTSPSACHPTDAGTSTPDGGSGYGPARFNAESGDDDCKYLVAFSTTPIFAKANAAFTITLSSLVDGTPVTGADPYLEANLGDTHLALNIGAQTNEVSPGIYTIGPVQFDESGRWVVRFHFFGSCVDLLPDSPHAHAAFFIDVP